MITFVCWKWKHPTYRTQFTAQHVNVWRASLARNYKHDHRAICITDDPTGIDFETFPLWDDCNSILNPNGASLPSCYRRLKLFSAATTQALGIEDGERVASIDLDVVFTGDLFSLFDRDAEFIAWQGVGSFRPIVYNGSLFMLRAGRMQWLWDEFDQVRSPLKTREARYYGSDQAWMSFRLNGSAPGWGDADGVYSYSRDVRRRLLPKNARIVCFNGKWKPWDAVAMAEAPWIARYWRL